MEVFASSMTAIVMYVILLLVNIACLLIHWERSGKFTVIHWLLQGCFVLLIVARSISFGVLRLDPDATTIVCDTSVEQVMSLIGFGLSNIYFTLFGADTIQRNFAKSDDPKTSRDILNSIWLPGLLAIVGSAAALLNLQSSLQGPELTCLLFIPLVFNCFAILLLSARVRDYVLGRQRVELFPFAFVAIASLLRMLQDALETFYLPDARSSICDATGPDLFLQVALSGNIEVGLMLTSILFVYPWGNEDRKYVTSFTVGTFLFISLGTLLGFAWFLGQELQENFMWPNAIEHWFVVARISTVWSTLFLIAALTFHAPFIVTLAFGRVFGPLSPSQNIRGTLHYLLGGAVVVLGFVHWFAHAMAAHNGDSGTKPGIYSSAWALHTSFPAKTGYVLIGSIIAVTLVGIFSVKCARTKGAPRTRFLHQAFAVLFGTTFCLHGQAMNFGLFPLSATFFIFASLLLVLGRQVISWRFPKVLWKCEQKEHVSEVLVVTIKMDWRCNMHETLGGFFLVSRDGDTELSFEYPLPYVLLENDYIQLHIPTNARNPFLQSLIEHIDQEGPAANLEPSICLRGPMESPITGQVNSIWSRGIRNVLMFGEGPAAAPLLSVYAGLARDGENTSQLGSVTLVHFSDQKYATYLAKIWGSNRRCEWKNFKATFIYSGQTNTKVDGGAARIFLVEEDGTGGSPLERWRPYIRPGDDEKTDSNLDNTWLVLYCGPNVNTMCHQVMQRYRGNQSGHEYAEEIFDM